MNRHRFLPLQKNHRQDERIEFDIRIPHELLVSESFEQSSEIQKSRSIHLEQMFIMQNKNNCLFTVWRIWILQKSMMADSIDKKRVHAYTTDLHAMIHCFVVVITMIVSGSKHFICTRPIKRIGSK